MSAAPAPDVGVPRSDRTVVDPRNDIVEAMAPRISRVRLGLRRSIVANQMLLAAAAFIGILVSISVEHVIDPSRFLAGAALLFAGAISAVLLPWDRVPQVWAALLPIVDVVAIALMRESAPLAGLGLLWTFPALWIGTVFGYGASSRSRSR